MNKNLQMRMLTVLGVLLASLYFTFPLEKNINLGLDLKGGMHLVLKVETEKLSENARQDAVLRAIEILRNRIDGLGVAEPVIQRQGEDQIIVQLPGITDREKAVRMIGQVAELNFAIVSDNSSYLQQALGGTVPEGYALKYTKDDKSPVLIENTPALRGDAVSDARVDFDSMNLGAPTISLTFNAEGSKEFARITREHTQERLAILLDGEVLSAPNINEPILSGQAEISGQFTYEEASLLALALRSGSLPAPMHIEEERTIGPLLGKDSIESGVRATIYGGIAVMIFMAFYYLKAGVISCIALMMNLCMLLGSLGLLNALMPDSQVTLTMPGIAGIILTLGMAIDANVLINERIREELQNGRPMQAAIAGGFNKAFNAIFDSNITTLIAAFMLFQFGSGPIKGFAVTLAIGMSASLFTGLFVSKTFFLLFHRLGLFKTLLMLQVIRNSNFDFIRYRYVTLVVSAAVIALGIFSLFQKGEKAYGIDFAGGQIQEYQFEKPVDTEQLRRALDTAGLGDVIIQRFEKNPQNVMIRSSEDTDEQVAQILQEKLADNPYTMLRIEKVGPIVGEHLRRSAVFAILLALGGILTYVGFRFKHFDFAAAGVIALLHDVLVALGMIVFMGRQVDLLVVTALLTIAGYSINDTIVIYDRVRENMARMRKISMREILNISLNQTLSRTILTSFATLLTVVCLYFLGGDVLNTFALTLLVGFVAGVYSTVFIASPLVLAWHNRQKKDA